MPFDRLLDRDFAIAGQGFQSTLMSFSVPTVLRMTFVMPTTVVLFFLQLQFRLMPLPAEATHELRFS